jgi:crotonobetainyl-CoA:carnitine CoA-transferase CaiB-like acyl-CoA transferase
LPDGEPVRPGLSVVDYMTGALTTVGTLIALYARDAGALGRGQVIDMALYESVVRALEFSAAHYSATGAVRRRVGNGGPAVPSNAYRTKDGRWVMLVTGEHRQFQRLMQAVGAPQLADDPRMASNAGRAEHRDELDGAISAWIAVHDLATVMDRMQAADIPLAAGYNVADLFADPHVAARGNLVEIEDPALGTLRVQGVVPRLSETPGSERTPAPLLGQHNLHVLGDLLGLSAAQLDELRVEHVI